MIIKFQFINITKYNNNWHIPPLNHKQNFNLYINSWTLKRWHINSSHIPVFWLRTKIREPGIYFNFNFTLNFNHFHMKRNQPKQRHSHPIPTMPHLMLNQYNMTSFKKKTTIFQWSSDNICLHRNRLVTFCSLWCHMIKHTIYMWHCGNINIYDIYNKSIKKLLHKRRVGGVCVNNW